MGLNCLQAYVSIIKSIARYRVLQINNQYYVVDIEESPRFFFFPFMTWTHMYTLYELEQEQARRISEYNKERGAVGLEAFSVYYFLIVGLSLALGKTIVSSGIAYIPFLNNTIVQWLFLLLAVAAIVYFRFVQHRKTYEKMHQLVDLKPLNRQYVKFYPVNKMNYVFGFVMWLFFLGFTCLSLGLFLQLNLLLGLISFWAFLSVVAIAFRLFVHPNYVYKCAFYE